MPKVAKSVAQAAAPVVKKARGSATTMVNVSPELAQLVNATTTTRPQALKSLWAYIKTQNLQKNEAGFYVCQGQLKTIIGKDQFGPPDVMKAISKHLTKIETPK